MSLTSKYLLFWGIVVLNLVLKSLFAGLSSFNFDEIVSVKNTLLDFGHIKHEAEWDNNPPFYYYCLWVWHQVIPVSEFNTRLLSVLFMSFGIGLSFLFAWNYFNRQTALFSAAFLSVSNFLLYYSLEARAYSLVLLLALISSLLFFRYTARPASGILLLLALVNFLLIYSHYIAGLLVLIQYVLIGVYFRPLRWQFFSLSTLLIAGLVFLRFTKKQFQNIFHFNQEGSFWLQPATPADLLQALGTLFYDPLMAWLLILLSLVAGIHLLRKKDAPSHLAQLYCFFAGLLAILFLFAVGTWKSVFLDRYLVFSVPFATMLAVYQAGRFRIYGLVVCVSGLLWLGWNYRFKKPEVMDYRELVTLLQTLHRPGDHIVIQTRDNLGLFEYYYDREAFMTVRNTDSLYRSQNIHGINDLPALEQIDFSKPGRIFLVQSFHKIHRADNPVSDYLSGRFRQLYTGQSYQGVEFSVFTN